MLSFGHIKADLPKGNPWDVPKPTYEPGNQPPPKRRIAWAGGNIISNKDESLYKFIKKKWEKGETLDASQVATLDRLVWGPQSTNGRRCQAASEADVPELLTVLSRKIERAERAKKAAQAQSQAQSQSQSSSQGKPCGKQGKNQPAAKAKAKALTARALASKHLHGAGSAKASARKSKLKLKFAGTKKGPGPSNKQWNSSRQLPRSQPKPRPQPKQHHAKGSQKKDEQLSIHKHIGSALKASR